MKANKMIIIIATVLFLSGILFGQATTARIHGKVTLEDGITVIPGVLVTASSPKMVGEASTRTDEKGIFRFFALNQGTYTIKFELKGFSTVLRKNISIQAGQDLAVNTVMKTSTIQETITVEGNVPLIDVKHASLEKNMTKDVFDALPKGRNFDSLVTTVPGVNKEETLSGISVDGASGAENVFYIDGTDTTNIVNGESGQEAVYSFVEEVQFKSSGYQAEFGGSVGGVINVVTRSGGNEFHGEIIGFYSGSALQGKRRDILQRAWDDNTKAVYMSYDDYWGKQDDYRLEGGLGLGGYIIKDKLWFFGSFMPVVEKLDRNITFYGTDINNDYSRSRTFWNFSAKLSAQPLRNVRWSASVVNNLYKWKGDFSGGGATPRGNPESDYSAYGFSLPNISASTSFDFTFGNNLIATLRGGYFRTNQTNPLVYNDGPQYIFTKEAPGGYIDNTNIGLPDVPPEYQRPAGWLNYGHNISRTSKKFIRQKLSINADFNYFLDFAGEHSIKMGIQYVHQGEDVDRTADYPIIRFAWGMDLIHSGVNYGSGTYGYYAVRGNDKTGPYGLLYNAMSNRWAFYLQDSWTIGDRLTLNLGVRTESEYVPTYSDDPTQEQRPIEFGFKDKIAPRLGFVYDVFKDSSLKIFGSYGIYYDVMKLNIAATSFGGEKIKMAYYTLDTYEWDTIGVNGNFPGTELYTPNNGVYNYRWYNDVDPNMKPMTQRAISFGAEKQINDNLSASIRVTNKHLIRAVEDIAIWNADTGWEDWYFGNPGYGYSLWVENGGIMDSTYPETPKATRDYWGVTLALEKRFSNNWQGGISYTWSSLRGNYSGLASSDEPDRANDPNFERYFDSWHLPRTKNLEVLDGPMATDRTHSLKAYGNYALPFGVTLGAVVNAMSGVPVSEEWRVIYEGYLPFGRGNLGRTPFLWYANLYAEYNIKLGKNTLNFNVNVDNLFNTSTARRIWQIKTANMVSVTQEELVNNTWDLGAYTPDPRFGMKMSFYPPISVRLGAKFIF